MMGLALNGRPGNCPDQAAGPLLAQIKHFLKTLDTSVIRIRDFIECKTIRVVKKQAKPRQMLLGQLRLRKARF